MNSREAPPDYKMPFAIIIAAGVLHALLAYLLFSWMAGLVLQQYTASFPLRGIN